MLSIKSFDGVRMDSVNKKEDKGLTILETMIVLVIIAIVAAFVYRNASTMFNQVDEGEESSNVQTVMTMAKQYKVEGKYKETNMIKTLITAGVFPESWIADTAGTTGKNKWGGSVTFTPSSDKYSFTLSTGAIPKKSCVTMVNKLRNFSLIKTINGKTASTLDLTTICTSESNTLTFASYN